MGYFKWQKKEAIEELGFETDILKYFLSRLFYIVELFFKQTPVYESYFNTLLNIVKLKQAEHFNLINGLNTLM